MVNVRKNSPTNLTFPYVLYQNYLHCRPLMNLLIVPLYWDYFASVTLIHSVMFRSTYLHYVMFHINYLHCIIFLLNYLHDYYPVHGLIVYLSLYGTFSLSHHNLPSYKKICYPILCMKLHLITYNFPFFCCSFVRSNEIYVEWYSSVWCNLDAFLNISDRTSWSGNRIMT